MPAFPSLINVDEFISDYFFTTDAPKGESFAKAVKQRYKQWAADAEDAATSPTSEGKGSEAAAQALANPYDRLNQHAQALLTKHTFAIEALEGQETRAALGATAATLGATARENEAATKAATPPLPEEVAAAVAVTCAIVGIPAETQIYRAESARGAFEVPAHARPGVLFLQAGMAPEAEVTDTFSLFPLQPGTLDAKPMPFSLHKLIGELFIATDASGHAPRMIVVLTPSSVFLAHRETWHLGRYLVVDLVGAIERGDRKAAGELRHVACAVAVENVTLRADATTWWEEVLAQAGEHSVSVSASLREAIRDSIEVIANDVLERRRAKGLPVTKAMGPELTHEALRYLYRILFLLFAEASPELHILPVGEDDYELGYGLARLRQQLLTRPQTQREAEGTYLYESLQVLFGLAHRGHHPADPDAGLTFEEVEADLFQAEKTRLIDATKLSNGALLRVLENLLLSRETRGKDRGFISYATLGVTELGQVYEGLMSYQGFIAEETLYEVAKHGDASKGSWVVPAALADADPTTYAEEHFITVVDPDTGEHLKRSYPPGSFVYRQSARDRERSASFYTPQVISQFTVRQAIEELQASGRITCAQDILELKLLEPALGSGAFGVEAIRQLAELYLTLRQEELGTQIPSEEYAEQLQRVKAYLALHCMYGVDLNATAVELGEISLWLDSMTAGLKAPWFGLHLRRGNSLIGAMRTVYSRSQVDRKEYLSGPGTTVSAADGSIYQFLLPSPTWGAAADAKELKQLLPDEAKQLRTWAKDTRYKLSKGQINQLIALSQRADELWNIAALRLGLAEAQVRRDITVFGHTMQQPVASVSRAEVEASLNNEHSALRRLRLVMDAWCALTFWPVDASVEPPSIEAWINACEQLLGTKVKEKSATHARQISLAEVQSWEDLDGHEEFALITGNAKRVEQVIEAHPWLKEVRNIAKAQAFFHWPLEFAPVLAAGGFDLIVGNPPWVRPRTNVEALLAEHDPWWILAHKPTQADKTKRRNSASEEARVTLVQGLTEVVATAKILADVTSYPYLVRQQPDLYRAFMSRAWALQSDDGVCALVHPESHFTDAKGQALRRATYPRLRRHFQFINELKLFDVHNLVEYGVHVYGASREQTSFLNMQGLYHPRTATESLQHNGSGQLPGARNSEGSWNLDPHAARTQTVTSRELALWAQLTGDSNTPPLEAKLGKTITALDLDLLSRLAAQPRVGELGLQFSRGWDESIDRKKGYFDHGWAVPTRWADAIIQGPHLGVSTPMIKQPNATLNSNKDWSEVDLEAMPADFIPATAYQRDHEKNTYTLDYTQWEGEDGSKRPATDFYRVAWRAMAAKTGYRTLYPAVIPPGATHVDAVFTTTTPGNPRQVLQLAANLSSLLNDFMIRSIVNTKIHGSLIDSLPLARNPRLAELAARLHCLTEAYAPLWNAVMDEPWTPDSPARLAIDRYWLQVEIDILVAQEFGISADELCTVYRTQFPVMRRYDLTEPFDANGRKVAKEVLKEIGSAEVMEWAHPQSGATYTFAQPFTCRDREADMREVFHRTAT